MSNGESRKVKRVRLTNPIKVVICSIGGQVRYDLTTKDISTTGFFLEYESPARFPFNRSTILEVWLTLEENRKIFFNGKMARVVYPKGEESENVVESSPGIGIKIVQISQENNEKLDGFIQSKAIQLGDKSA